MQCRLANVNQTLASHTHTHKTIASHTHTHTHTHNGVHTHTMESTHTHYTHSGVRNLATQDTRTHNNEVSCAAVLEFALVRWAGVARTTKSTHSVFSSNIGTHTRQQRAHTVMRSDRQWSEMCGANTIRHGSRSIRTPAVNYAVSGVIS